MELKSIRSNHLNRRRKSRKIPVVWNNFLNKKKWKWNSVCNEYTIIRRQHPAVGALWKPFIGSGATSTMYCPTGRDGHGCYFSHRLASMVNHIPSSGQCGYSLTLEDAKNPGLTLPLGRAGRGLLCLKSCPFGLTLRVKTHKTKPFSHTLRVKGLKSWPNRSYFKGKNP